MTLTLSLAALAYLVVRGVNTISKSTWKGGDVDNKKIHFMLRHDYSREQCSTFEKRTTFANGQKQRMTLPDPHWTTQTTTCINSYLRLHVLHAMIIQCLSGPFWSKQVRMGGCKWVVGQPGNHKAFRLSVVSMSWEHEYKYALSLQH